MTDEQPDRLPCTPPPCPPIQEATVTLTAAGGWCAPSDLLYDAGLLQERVYDVLTFPEVSVPRGGITFGYDPDPAAVAAADALRAQISRAADQVLRQREQAIRNAVALATTNGWDVHLWPHHESHWRTARSVTEVRQINRLGIEFRPARYGIPTVVEHPPTDVSWTDDEDWT